MIHTSELVKMDVEELRKLNKAVINAIKSKTLHSCLAAAKNFSIGDRVEFDTKKWPFKIQGTISKISVKSVTLTDCSDKGPGWRVTTSLIRKVD